MKVDMGELKPTPKGVEKLARYTERVGGQYIRGPRALFLYMYIERALWQQDNQ